MRVLMLSRYGYLGPGSRVRMYQYIPYLRSQGIEIVVSPLLDDWYIESLYSGKRADIAKIIKAYVERLKVTIGGRRFDTIWLQWEMFPWLPALGEWLYLKLGIPYVVDYDDAIFARYEHHPRRIVRVLLRDKIEAVMRNAAAVVVGNDYLSAYACASGAKKVHIVPSVIDLFRYHSVQATPAPGATIGWMGTPNTVFLLNQIGPALQSVCERFRATLVVVGARQSDVPGIRAEFRPWHESTEVADIQSFDIGIMPVQDDAFFRGKCGYKLIQYMACGLPVVASPVGVNSKIVTHGTDGLLAHTATEWEDALCSLLADSELRNRLGSNGRKKVEQEYCLQVTAPKIDAILRANCRIYS